MKLIQFLHVCFLFYIVKYIVTIQNKLFIRQKIIVQYNSFQNFDQIIRETINMENIFKGFNRTIFFFAFTGSSILRC